MILLYFYIIILYYYLLFFLAESLKLDLEELITDSKNLHNSILPGFTEIVQYVVPSMELFYKEIFMPKVPALMKGNVLLSICIFKKVCIFFQILKFIFMYFFYKYVNILHIIILYIKYKNIYNK